MNMNSYFGSVSGVCVPCKDIQQATLTAQILKIELNQEDINNCMKVGKEAGIWYVVAQNSGVLET